MSDGLISLLSLGLEELVPEDYIVRIVNQTIGHVEHRDIDEEVQRGGASSYRI